MWLQELAVVSLRRTQRKTLPKQKRGGSIESPGLSGHVHVVAHKRVTERARSKPSLAEPA